METILWKLLLSLGDGYKLVRVNVKEDENYGEALIENPNGTPSHWSYNSEIGIWE